MKSAITCAVAIVLLALPLGAAAFVQSPELRVDTSGNFTARGMTVQSVGSNYFTASVWGTTWSVDLSRSPSYHMNSGQYYGGVIGNISGGDEVQITGVADTNRNGWIFATEIRNVSRSGYGTSQTNRCYYGGYSMEQWEARNIAASTVQCTQVGTLSTSPYCNSNSGTWWVDITPYSSYSGCNPACVVNVQTRSAEVNWRCTGYGYTPAYSYVPGQTSDTQLLLQVREILKDLLDALR